MRPVSRAPQPSQIFPMQPQQPADRARPRLSSWVLLPLRLFLGVTFVYAGVQKLADPQFFNPASPGYIGRQMLAFAHGSPLQALLLALATHNPALTGLLIAVGEIAIGLGALLGLLLRPAACFGLLLSLCFFLSASWHVYPYFYGSDIVFAVCWLTLLLNGPLHTGLPTIDAWLVEHIWPAGAQTERSVTRWRTLLVGGSVAALPASSVPESATRSKRRSQAQEERETRRTFLVGGLTGGAIGIVGFTLLSYLMRALSPANSNTSSSVASPDSQPPTPLPASTSTDTAAGTPVATSAAAAGGVSSRGVIAQLSAVPKNTAFPFTLASNGDPALLVHLPNDTFVAFDATCTHAGCQVDYVPDTRQFVCPCHGATYDPARAAAVVSGPAPSPLTSVPIHVDSATGAISMQ